MSSAESSKRRRFLNFFEVREEEVSGRRSTSKSESPRRKVKVEVEGSRVLSLTERRADLISERLFERVVSKLRLKEKTRGSTVKPDSGSEKGSSREKRLGKLRVLKIKESRRCFIKDILEDF